MAIKQNTKIPSYFSNLKGPKSSNINVFGAVNAGARATGIKSGNQGPSQEELMRNNADAYVRDAIERSSGGLDFSQLQNLPPSIKAIVNDKIKNTAANIGYMTSISRNMASDDFMGQSALNNNISNEKSVILNDIPNEFKMLNDKIGDFMSDYDQGLVSEIEAPELLAKFAGIKSGDIPVSIGQDNKLYVGDERVQDLDTYSLKNYPLTKYMLGSHDAAYKLGKQPSKQEVNLERINFEQALRKSSNNDLLSGAFEDLMGTSNTLIDPSLKNQFIEIFKNGTPEQKINAKNDLISKMTEAHMGLYNQQISAGIEAVKPKISENDVDLETWYSSFDNDSTPGGTPTPSDWQIELQNIKGRPGSLWENGFMLTTLGDEEGKAGERKFTVTKNGKSSTYDEKTFYTDKIYKKLLGMDIETFEKLNKEERIALFNNAGIVTQKTGGSSAVVGGTYLIPTKLAASSQSNKKQAGIKIDPSLNKEEIISIVNRLSKK